MKSRTLILVICFLFAACESGTKEPGAVPEVKIIKVRETGKIKAAWEAQAQALEVELESELMRQEDTKTVLRGSRYLHDVEASHREMEALRRESIAEARERAAQAEEVSLEQAITYAVNAEIVASSNWEFAEENRGDRILGDLAIRYEAEAEAWYLVVQAWKEVVEATE